jgi:PAS domain S-box-containing protein
MEDGRLLVRRSMRKVRLPAGAGSLPGFALASGEVVVTEDLIGDERFTTRAPERGVPVVAAVAAPIEWETVSFGAFVVYDRSARRWTTDEVRFVGAVSATIGLALQRGRIEEELQESSTRLDLSLSAGGLGAWSWDLAGDRVELSAAALAIYGLSTETFGGTGLDWLAVVHPDDRETMPNDLAAARAPGDQHRVFRIIRPDNGELRWIESWGRQLDADERGLHLVGVCSDITDRRRAEQVREELLASEHEARISSERARRRMGFLSDASTVLASSLDPDEVLDQLATMCVGQIADACVIDVLDEDGQLHPATAKVAAELGVDRALGPGAGRAEVICATSGGMVDLEAAGADALRRLPDVAVVSALVVPMVARGRTIGVLMLARAGPGAERYQRDEDLAMAEDLASRAAMAVENGRLYRSRERVARSLQAVLLPPALPEIAGVELAARYSVAELDAEIGGDFYDVMALDARSWGVVVGDVCGRGPDAAALTGLVRQSLRTAAVHEQRPVQILTRTNEALLAQIDDARFCTAAFLVVHEPDGNGEVRIEVASAGHPRPVLVRTGGEVVPLDALGTVLGVVADPVLSSVDVVLEPGDAVVLYTDGLTEARRGTEWYGEGRLVELLEALAGRAAEEIATGLEASVSAFRRSARDDTAILVVAAAHPA